MEGQLILDRYRPLSELGEGGFGAVTLAWDTRMQRRVAIKRMRLPLNARGVPERPPGLAEARTAAMLNHPAIVTVFDFDTDADEAFLVMEYVDGVTLGELLDHVEGPLTLDEAAAVMEGVASALEFAHDNGVLHLDIKPDNVLLTREGHVKVADFGMAELSSLSGHGPAWGGTPGYMPPEQLRGEAVDETSDEWALAALAFESLTGTNPFSAGDVREASSAIDAYPAPLASRFERSLPTAVDAVLLAALDPRPEERYESVAAFADALLMLLGDADVGIGSLARLIGEVAGASDEMEPGLDSVGVWDRLGGRLGSMLLRAVAAVEAGWLAWTGLTPFSFGLPAALGAVALIAAAGALAPPLGVGLGLACLIAGVFVSGAWAVGVIAVVVVLSWWWLLGRRSAGAAVLPLAAPVLSVIRMGLAQPLLAGFALTPAEAAGTGLLGGILAALASAMSLGAAPFLDVRAAAMLDPWSADLALANIRALVLTPAAYVALAGWPLAAAVMSFFCRKGTRLGALAGTVAGTAVLGGAYLLADLVATGDVSARQWAGNGLAIGLSASLILILIVATLGPPIRAEDDETPP